ncbi:hypothetical protein LUZ61_008448 [Rhynchospora tenuis]|uniref:RBR-type E3 ubiquitin transferase n=1 Tax=Rhynchospora tenuis TaxID=198213 RepID=A0AAD6EXG4_9POAL|nr:hypothetical protein LUZ61_008448 [Rhynchospora tenuis]
MVGLTSPGSIQLCEICLNSNGTRNSCAHSFCSKCLSEYMLAELKLGAVTIKCPSDGCEVLLDPTICKTFIWSKVYNKWRMAPGSKNFDIDQPPTSTEQGNPCGICQKNKGTRVGCSHIFCRECLSLYVQTELQSGIAVSLKCPEDSCNELLEPNQCKGSVRLSVYSQWRIAIRRYKSGLQMTNQEYQQVSKVVPMSDVFYCNICMNNVPNSNSFNVNPCSHTFCTECVTQHLLTKISERIANIHCPEPTCREGVFEPDRCRKILDPEIFDRWSTLMIESTIGSNKLKCPFEDCSALLPGEADHQSSKSTIKRRCVFLGIPCSCAIKKKEIPEAKMSKCPHCNRHFCVHCRVPWHDGLSCDEYFAGKDREDFLKLQRLACFRSSIPDIAK